MCERTPPVCMQDQSISLLCCQPTTISSTPSPSPRMEARWRALAPKVFDFGMYARDSSNELWPEESPSPFLGMGDCWQSVVWTQKFGSGGCLTNHLDQIK